MDKVAQIPDMAIALTMALTQQWLWKTPGKEQGYGKVLSPSRLVFGLWGISLASSCYHSTRAPVRPAPSLEALAALKCVRHLTCYLQRPEQQLYRRSSKHNFIFISRCPFKM